jgi:phage tail protein X
MSDDATVTATPPRAIVDAIHQLADINQTTPANTVIEKPDGSATLRKRCRHRQA